MRNSEIYRQTRETEIKVRLELDGDGLANINTPIYFFNHAKSNTGYSILK